MYGIACGPADARKSQPIQWVKRLLKEPPGTYEKHDTGSAPPIEATRMSADTCPAGTTNPDIFEEWRKFCLEITDFCNVKGFSVQKPWRTLTPSRVTSMERMQRIIVTNAKGGCGKSTIATNLAARLSNAGTVSLFDYDAQASSMHWLKLRGERHTTIHGVAAHRQPANGVTRTFQLRTPPNTRYLVMDTPAGTGGTDLAQLVQHSDAVIIPVLPSPIDIHAAAHFVRDLLIVGKARSYNVRIGVVANRVRKNTIMYQALRQFLRSLNITFITALRDTQNYAKASHQGVGIHELKSSTAYLDCRQWEPLLQWLNDAPSDFLPARAASEPVIGYRDAVTGKAQWKKISA